MKRKSETTCLFQYTLSGFGMVEIKERSYPIAPGTAFMVRIPSEHRYFLPEESDHWEFLWIMMRGTEVDRLWTEAETLLGQTPKFSPESPLIRYLLSMHREASKHRIVDRYQASGFVYQFMMELCRSKSANSQQTATWPESIQRAMDYLHQHYANLNSVDEIAGAVGLTKFHFIRLFAKTTGLTPVQYLTKIRIQKSVELLRRTGLTVEEIAHQVGYANGNYFTKVFRPLVGISPGEFRLGRDMIGFDHIMLD
jgi:AraC-like DNA-binding protein